MDCILSAGTTNAIMLFAWLLSAAIAGHVFAVLSRQLRQKVGPFSNSNKWKVGNMAIGLIAIAVLMVAWGILMSAARQAFC
jgi:hypothetical protein